MNKLCSIRIMWPAKRLSLGSLLLAVSLLLSNCGAKPQGLPVVLQEAMAHNRKGIVAQQQGRHQVSREEFRQAYALYASVENAEGMLTTLINLSRIARRQNSLDQAQVNLDLAATLSTDDPTLKAELAFETSLLLLARGAIDEAQQWVVKAIYSTPKQDKGSYFNLLARILFLQGDDLEAERTARRALNILKGQEPTEQANAYRLLGDINVKAGLFETAIEFYLKALAADKQGALSPRIAEDLQRLAQASLKKNSTQAAIDYFSRALSVSMNGGDSTTAAIVLDEMINAYSTAGLDEKATHLKQKKRELLNLSGE